MRSGKILPTKTSDQSTSETRVDTEERDSAIVRSTAFDKIGESEIVEYHLRIKSRVIKERRSWIAEERKGGARGKREGC